MLRQTFPKTPRVVARFKHPPRLHHIRPLSSSQYTPSGARDRRAVGPFTPKAAVLFVATGIGLYFYFQREKRLLLERRQKETQDSSVGRPSVGGPFTLTSHTGETVTEKLLLGKWNLVYFGFTNCPDICPAELDKMGDAISALEKKHGPIFQALFISVDPARDTLPQIARYLQDFHPAFIGATAPPSQPTRTSKPASEGSEKSAPTPYAAVKAVCKAYRVYFSTPPDADPNGDYLVDHSIFIYFMNPQGEFVEAFGQAKTTAEIVERIDREIDLWQKARGSRV